MKQRIRRIWLALCMAVCLFALAGCSAAADTAETIDPQIEMAMQSGSQQYLDLFCRKSDTAKQYVQKWMPIVAASQSVKGNAREREFLLSWVNVVDYE